MRPDEDVGEGWVRARKGWARVRSTGRGSRTRPTLCIFQHPLAPVLQFSTAGSEVLGGGHGVHRGGHAGHERHGAERAGALVQTAQGHLRAPAGPAPRLGQVSLFAHRAPPAAERGRLRAVPRAPPTPAPRACRDTVSFNGCVLRATACSSFRNSSSCWTSSRS